ncbi:MAG TPA: anaerobic ribonucleoside-triphosphate reductase activating protein [Candidatus Fimousia stercorigallinarum]|nr:anaerobic ribonucleoside-triphosphate reductase activating protein [Candidatus Fimousia stercorigallinarum]
MAFKIRVSGIVEESIVDGPGFRYVIFTQGCPHHCPGCHNPQTHSFEGGTMMDIEDIFRAFCENPLLAGITFSGGEPFCQPKPLYELAVKVHKIGKSVMTYTGYTYEQLEEIDDIWVKKLLSVSDILVDGPYIEELRDLDLQFRGSSNQRVLYLS